MIFEEYVNAGTEFSVRPSSPHIHYSYIAAQYTYPRHIPITTVTHHPVMWPAEVAQKFKMGPVPPLSAV